MRQILAEAVGKRILTPAHPVIKGSIDQRDGGCLNKTAAVEDQVLGRLAAQFKFRRGIPPQHCAFVDLVPDHIEDPAFFQLPQRFLHRYGLPLRQLFFAGGAGGGIVDIIGKRDDIVIPVKVSDRFFTVVPLHKIIGIDKGQISPLRRRDTGIAGG